FLGDFDHLRIDVDADAALGPELLDGGDEHDRVAAAQVVHHILLGDLAKLAHTVDNVLGRRHPAHHDIVLDIRRLAQIDDLFRILDGDFFLARDGRVVVRLPAGGDGDVGQVGGDLDADLAVTALGLDLLAVDRDHGLGLRHSHTQGDVLAVFLLDSPQMHEAVIAGRTLDRLGVLGLPFAHQKTVRHDAGARFERLPQDRFQAVVDVVAHVEQDDVGIGEVIDLEHVALADGDLVGDAGFGGFFLGDLDHLRIDIDADAALGAELLDGGDEHDRVAAAQVVDHVVFADLGNRAHALDDVLRRRHP